MYARSGIRAPFFESLYYENLELCQTKEKREICVCVCVCLCNVQARPLTVEYFGDSVGLSTTHLSSVSV